MKNLATLLFSFLLVGITVNATPVNNTALCSMDINSRYDGNAYIFNEGTVEFSVFPDGQFDFVFVGVQNDSQVTISSPNGQVSFNTGRDHEAYVQYDDYGAVIQVEEVEIYYDAFGRIIQAGNIDIQYNDRRLVRVGGLNVHYNNYGHFGYTTGFINVYNRGYFFQPWHTFYVRPIFASCIVWDVPYRRFYTPFRYNYYTHIGFWNNRHQVTYINGRRGFYTPGSRVHYRNGKTAVNRDYRSNRPNSMVNRHGRDNGYARANTRTSNARTTTNDRVNSRVTNRSNNTTSSNTRGTSRHTKTVAQNTSNRNNSSATRNGARGSNAARGDTAKKTSTSTAKRTSRTITRTGNSNARKSNASSKSRRTAKVNAPSKERSAARTSSRRDSKTTTTARKSSSRSSSASRGGSRSTSRATPNRGRGL